MTGFPFALNVLTGETTGSQTAFMIDATAVVEEWDGTGAHTLTVQCDAEAFEGALAEYTQAHPLTDLRIVPGRGIRLDRVGWAGSPHAATTFFNVVKYQVVSGGGTRTATLTCEPRWLVELGGNAVSPNNVSTQCMTVPWGLRSATNDRFQQPGTMYARQLIGAALFYPDDWEACFPWSPALPSGTQLWKDGGSYGTVMNIPVLVPTRDMSQLETLRWCEDQTGHHIIFTSGVPASPTDPQQQLVGAITNADILAGQVLAMLDYFGAPVTIVEGRDFDSITTIDDATEACQHTALYTLSPGQDQMVTWNGDGFDDPAWGGPMLRAATTSASPGAASYPLTRAVSRQITVNGLDPNALVLVRSGVRCPPVPWQPIRIMSSTEGQAISTAIVATKVDYLSGECSAQLGTSTAGLFTVRSGARSVHN